jgi:hypothetical protein
MNKLDLTNNGGDPFVGDDIMYMQNALRQAINGSISFLRKGLQPSPFDKVIVLFGCNITIVGPNFTYTQGFVWIDDGSSFEGEIFYVPAQTIPQPIVVGGQFNFLIVQANNALGIETYENLTTQNTYKDRTATIQNSTTFIYLYSALAEPEGILLTMIDSQGVFAKLSDLVPYALKSIDVWNSMAANADFLQPSAAFYIRYQKDAFDCINIQGHIQSTGIQTILAGPSSQFSWVGILPVGYRPSKKNLQLCGIYAAGSPPAQRWVLIETTGDMYIIGPTFVSGFYPADAGEYYIDIKYKI